MNRFLFRMLRFSGLPTMLRYFWQRNRVTILLFHNIYFKDADKVFLWLKENYNIISLNDYIEARQKNDSSRLPRKALIITFDDGHINNYKLLPMLKKYEIPITIFLCSSIINTNKHFWFTFRHKNISHSKMKRVSNTERLNTLSKYGFEQDKEFNEPQALQRWHIEEMKSLVNFQSHTKYHPILPNLSNEESLEEISGSKSCLEKDFNLEIDSIAYPNGDYSERDLNIVEKSGYRCGLTVDFGYNDMNTDIFRLKRISVNDSHDLNEVAVKSSGLWAIAKERILKN